MTALNAVWSFRAVCCVAQEKLFGTNKNGNRVGKIDLMVFHTRVYTQLLGGDII